MIDRSTQGARSVSRASSGASGGSRRSIDFKRSPRSCLALMVRCHPCGRPKASDDFNIFQWFIIFHHLPNKMAILGDIGIPPFQIHLYHPAGAFAVGFSGEWWRGKCRSDISLLSPRSLRLYIYIYIFIFVYLYICIYICISLSLTLSLTLYNMPGYALWALRELGHAKVQDPQSHPQRKRWYSSARVCEKGAATWLW